MSRRLLALITALLLVVAACGDDGDSSPTGDTAGDAAPETPAPDETETPDEPEPEPEPLTILVTNDDGIDAPGIDALVQALGDIDGVELVVVAPAENQSGTSDTTSEGDVAFADGATASGVEGTAVSGTPADAVNVALGELGLEPDLVVSGVNSGQNIGPFASLSGTVGAARTAARQGVPAVAVSAGLSETTDFGAAAQLVVDWIEEHRAEIEEGGLTTDTIVSFNIPDCTAGEIGPLVETELDDEIPEGVNPFETDCSLRDDSVEPETDVDAITTGYAAETLVPIEL